MDKNETISKYELMLIVDAQLSTDDKENIFKEAADIVSKEGGKVINGKIWMDKQKFTSPIKKRSEGTYYLINFEAEDDTSQKIRPGLKLNEKILRFATMKV